MSTLSTTEAELQYFLARSGTSYGPYSADQIVSFHREGLLTPEDLFWEPTASTWLPILQAPCLKDQEPALNSLEVPLEVEDVPVSNSPPTMPTMLAAERKPEPLVAAPDSVGQDLLDDWKPEEMSYLRPANDSTAPLLRASGLGLFAHFLLFGALMLTAGSVFHLEVTKPIPKPEPPPLEVDMVEEPPPPPPAPPPPPDFQPPVPMPPIPPPPMEDPPPPPAPPLIPIEQPVVQNVPNLKPPPVMPPPVEPTPPRPPSQPAVAQARPTHVRPVQEPAAPDVPTSNEPQDVGASDYLYAPKPIYPPDAMRMRLGGQVIVLASVSSSGDALSVRIGGKLRDPKSGPFGTKGCGSISLSSPRCSGATGSDSLSTTSLMSDYYFRLRTYGSGRDGRIYGLSPPPTPPDMRFFAFGG